MLFSKIASSQISVGISIGGIGYHPIEEKNENAEFYKWKFDKKGKMVGFASVTFFFSYRFNDYIGAKVMQSFVFHDCAGNFAGVTHLGVDLHDDIIGWKNPSNQFSLSFGPFWYYRKNWSQEPHYKNDPNFMKLSDNGVWESKFVWHGGQIEYDHFINANEALSINFLPGYPYLYTFGVGMKQISNSEIYGSSSKE